MFGIVFDRTLKNRVVRVHTGKSEFTGAVTAVLPYALVLKGETGKHTLVTVPDFTSRGYQLSLADEEPTETWSPAKTTGTFLASPHRDRAIDALCELLAINSDDMERMHMVYSLVNHLVDAGHHERHAEAQLYDPVGFIQELRELREERA